jgi:hypothetical protein
MCEDPKLIRSWFALLHNTIAKYGIVNADIYNFDETGFMMGVLSTAMVVTSSERSGRAKAKQPGKSGMGYSDSGCECDWLVATAVHSCKG